MASDAELLARIEAASQARDAELLARIEGKPAANPNAPSALASLARGVERGVTFGFNDELKGLQTGIGGLFTGEGYGPAYERGRDTARAQDRLDDEENPFSGLAGQVVGGVGGALVAAPAAAASGATALGARLAAPVARHVGPLVNPLLQMLPGWVRTGGSMAGGAAAGGAVAGFGEGEGGLGPRAVNAVEGAGIGGGAGLALGGAGRIISGAVGRGTHALGLRNPEVAADRQTLRALDRSGVPLDDAAARLAASGGAPLALVDVGGRNTVGLGAVAANTPGAAMEAADTFVQGRRISRPDRLTTAGDTAFGGGSGPGVATRNAALDAERRANAGPLYDQVRAFGEVDDPQVTDALLRLPDNVLARAGVFARLAGQEPERLVTAGDAGRELTRLPTTTDLDHIARALGDSIEAAQRAGDGTLARELTLARVGLLARLDDIVVDPNTGQRIYADARAAYAGPSRQLEAIEEGRTALRTDRDTVAEAMQGPADVQAAYRLGAGRDFTDRVSDPGRASGAARLMLEDGQMQARLASMLPPAEHAALNAALRREVEMTAVERTVSPRAGSQTGRLAAGGEDMANDPIGPGLSALAQLGTGQWLNAAGTVGRGMLRRAQGINPATSDALAQRLFATDPAVQAQVIAQLRNRLLDDEQAAERARIVGGRVLRGIGGASSLGVNEPPRRNNLLQ